MTNKFEKAYREYRVIKDAFQAAEKEKSEAGMEKARADYKVWQKGYESEGNIFAEIYSQYEESLENGNDCLNFSNYIRTVKEHMECLKENGITRFTFSSGWSGAIENALELQKEGFQMTGLTEVKGKEDPWTGKRETLAALVFERA